MAWIKAGTTTLGSAGSTITVSSIPDSVFYKCLIYTPNGSGTIHNITTRFNSDTGSNYADRVSNSGGGDVTHNLTYMIVDAASADCFHISYLLNIATEEKLQIGFSVDQSSTGAGTAPVRREIVGKWVNTSNAITSAVVNNGGGGDFDTNSNITVLGSDGTEELNVQDGAIYYETDTNKEYVLYNNTWTEV